MPGTSPLRLLLWLKWRLLWRGYRRNAMKIVGTVLLLLVFLPLSVGAASVVWWAGRAHPWLAFWLARDALAVIYVLWAVTPLLGFQFNESYDLTKLFVYPLSYRQIFLGSVLGNLLDISVWFMLPTLGVLLALFSSSPAALLLNFVLLLLFLLHTLALGQAITLTLIGFLRSRRFRDITIVLFPLLGMAYYLGQQTFFRHFGGSFDARVLDAPAWHVANGLPPGYAAFGLNAAAEGRWGPALLWMAALAAAGALTLWIAATALKNLYLGDAGPTAARAAPPRPAVRAREPGRGLLARLPDDVAAIARKEFLYFQREPQYKAMAVNVLYTLVAVAAPFLFPALSRSRHGGGLASLGDYLYFGLTGTLLLAMMPLLFNIFGGEGAAITVLFSLPTRRRALLLGKNVAHLCLLLGLNIVGLIVVAAISGGWGHLPLPVAWVLIAAPVLLAAGNLVSIRFPHRMLVRGQRWQKGGMASAGGGDGSGCAYIFLYLLAYLAAFVALLPGVAAVLLPTLFGWSPLWYVLTLPLALAYALVLYVVLLGQAEVWLLAREPEIAAKIVPAD